MIPYSNNNINFNIQTPKYIKQSININSRYSVYKVTDNFDKQELQIKLNTNISNNETYKGYYYTLEQNENLYQIAKKYYDNENYWWVIAKANNLKNNGLIMVETGVTLIIPAAIELTTSGGYFSDV